MQKATMTVDTDPHKGLSRPTPVEKLEEVEVLPRGKKLKIGSALPRRIKEDLIAFLRNHLDAFAWEVSDMLGIDPAMITHYFSINEG